MSYKIENKKEELRSERDHHYSYGVEEIKAEPEKAIKFAELKNSLQPEFRN